MHPISCTNTHHDVTKIGKTSDVLPKYWVGVQRGQSYLTRGKVPL